MGNEETNDGLLGGDIVFTPVRVPSDAERGSAARRGGARQGRVLMLADGRRTVADILRVSPFPRAETLQHLRALCEEGLLVHRAEERPEPARGGQVVVIDARPRGFTPSGGVTTLGGSASKVVVIDTRHRDRAAPTADRALVTRAPSAPATSAGRAAAASSAASLPANGTWSATHENGTSPSASSSSAAVVTPTSLYRLGDYEVVTRIGQGGMGSVYVCRKVGDKGIDRLYTLKVVRQYSAQQELAEASLLREARVGPWLSHPSIHSVVDTGTYKDQPYIILDYVEGVSLSDLLTGGRRPPPGVVVSIMLDALRALERAHGVRDERGNLRGLVHGDISPPNILVGTDGVSRLTDFGSCRILSEDGANQPDALKLGKPSYMAPEQLCAEPLDNRTDLFALGVVMYTAITGQDLFAAESYAQIVLNVLRKRIPPGSELGAPACFDEFCRRALSRPREGRFASASDMAKALVAVSSAEGLLASPGEVAAYVRAEFGEILDERRRRIQRAAEGVASPRVSTWDMSESNGKAQTGGSIGAEKKLAPTLFIPGPDDATPDASDRALARAVKRAPRVKTETDMASPGREAFGELWRLLSRERPVIAASIAVGIVLAIVMGVWGARGSTPQKARAGGVPAVAGTTTATRQTPRQP
jgi:serine/threonine-protein kinase